MKTFLEVLRKIGVWIKAHWKWVLGGLAVIVAFIVGARVARKPTPPANISKGQERIAYLQGEINQLEGLKTVIKSQETSTEADIEDTTRRVKILDDKITAAREEVDKLDAEEKLKRFKELGY